MRSRSFEKSSKTRVGSEESFRQWEIEEYLLLILFKGEGRRPIKALCEMWGALVESAGISGGVDNPTAL